jgi:hypothetical protein
LQRARQDKAAFKYTGKAGAAPRNPAVSGTAGMRGDAYNPEARDTQRCHWWKKVMSINHSEWLLQRIIRMHLSNFLRPGQATFFFF